MDSAPPHPLPRAGQDLGPARRPSGRSATRRQTVGDRQVRNAGTVGGSLCWNDVASCMPNVCLCLDATLILTSLAGGERTVPIDEFLIGPLENRAAGRRAIDRDQLPPVQVPRRRERLQEARCDGGRVADHRHRGLDQRGRIRGLHRCPLQRRRRSADRPAFPRRTRATLRPAGHARDVRRGRERLPPMRSRRKRTALPAPTIARC